MMATILGILVLLFLFVLVLSAIRIDSEEQDDNALGDIPRRPEE